MKATWALVAAAAVSFPTKPPKQPDLLRALLQPATMAQIYAPAPPPPPPPAELIGPENFP